MTEPFLTVNMHCHSSHSDGSMGTDELADFLARNRVQFAALTDHDTVRGVESFHDSCIRYGIGFVSGVELTTASDWGELHLLCYGFNYRDSGLDSFLAEVSRSRKWPGCRDAVDLIHSKGGKVFMAHPLTVTDDYNRLSDIVRELVNCGLDGIEAFYSQYTGEQQSALAEIAERFSLPVSAGTDFHGIASQDGLDRAGVGIQYSDWKRFRDTVNQNITDRGLTAVETGSGDNENSVSAVGSHLSGRQSHWPEYLKIILPALFSVVLFTVAIFSILIPRVENMLISRKKEMIMELTNSAVSILEEFSMDIDNGLIDTEEAKKKAARIIEYIRYGKEHKDYFWITDTTPVMIVHPYRKELEGKYVGDYVDNAGTPVFMKIVEAVRENSEGYIEYQWQWKDEESRIMSKLSYVKLYKPWGWIIGTGIYLEDLDREIGRIEKFLVTFSLEIIILVSILLFYLVGQSIRTEKVKLKKEKALAESNEKYRTLMSATGEGTLIIQEGKCSYANPRVQEILGYTEEELLLMTVNDLIVPESVDSSGRYYAQSLLSNEMVPSVCETGMRRRDGKFIDVILQTDRISFSGREGFIVNVRETEKGERLSHIRDRKKNRIIAELQSSILFLSEPVSGIAREALVCGHKTRISEAAALMSEKKVSSIFVSAESGDIVGIVTDHDLRERAVSGHLNLSGPVYSIMSSPVVSVPETSLIYEAITVMRSRDIRHLALTGPDGKPVSVVRAKELLSFHKYPVAVLTAEINMASTFMQLRRSFSQMPVMMKTLVDTGARPENITRMISSFADSLTKRIIEIAEAELGPPPVPYAFISLGSHGRGEPTLVSDQDNAIIYRGGEGESRETGTDREAVKKHLTGLGGVVCSELEKAGFEPCRGGIMAGNPRWVCTIGEWKKHFTGWITEPRPEELLKFNMFFDFRIVYGDSSLTDELREHITELLKLNPSFFGHLAQNTLLYKTPVGFFGNIIFNTDDSSNQVFDVKEAMLPIVSFARIYALKHGISQTGTYERLFRLKEKGILIESSYNEILNVYDYLMQMRLDNQSNAMDSNLEPGNMVTKSGLTSIEAALLKNSLNQISDMQKRIVYDFMGGVSPH